MTATSAFPTFTDAERQRGMVVLYLNNFLMYGGFFMVVPLISLHYGVDLGWSTATVGMVLAVRQLVQQGLAIIGGIIADRVGAKFPIIAGMLVRSAGFAWMAFADTPATLFGSAILAAFGGSLFEAPKSAAGAALARPEQRSRFYTTLGVAGNLGMAGGPPLGAFLLRWDFAAVCLVAAAIFVVGAAIETVLLPRVPVAAKRPEHALEGMVLALRDRRFVVFTCIVMGFWFLAVQYSISLPLIAKHLGGSDASVGKVLFVYSAVTIVLQYPLVRFLSRYLGTMTILTAGVLVMAFGLGAVALAGSIGALIACTAVFAVGNLLSQPMVQTATARLVDPVALGSYFAVGAYAIAIGGAIGNLGGGALYQWGRTTGHAELPWLTIGAVGVAAALLFVWFARRWYPGDVGPEGQPHGPSASEIPPLPAQRRWSATRTLRARPGGR